jgi:hypothetical protein
MRIVPAVTVVALLVLLLTWLSLRAIDPNAERFDLALREMDNFKTLEAALHRDVLSARAGVLRNYDPLVRETGALDVSIARLRQVAATDIVTKTAIDRLAVMVVEQGHLVEQFKSDNALLQNSLAYFALSSSDWGGSVAPSVSSLAAAMLRLTLDTSSASAHEVQDRLDELAREPFPSGDAEAVQALLAHGRLIRNLLEGALRGAPDLRTRGPPCDDPVAAECIEGDGTPIPSASLRHIAGSGRASRPSGFSATGTVVGITTSRRLRARTRRHLNALHCRRFEGFRYCC